MCSSQRSQAFDLATTTERLQVGRGYTRLTLHPPSWSHVPRRKCTVIALENSSILKSSLWVVHVSVVVALNICYTNGVVHTRNLLTMASCSSRLSGFGRVVMLTEEKTRANLQYMLDEISSTLIWHFHSPLVDLSPYKQIGAANIAVNNVANNAPATANCHFSCGKGSQLRQFSWAWFLDWAL